MPATPLIRPPCMRPREESRIRYPYRRRGIRPERRHKVRSRKRVSHLAPLLVQTQPSAGTKQSPQRTGTSSRSEEHTSELQSLMRISYAVFCLKKTKLRLTHI